MIWINHEYIFRHYIFKIIGYLYYLFYYVLFFFYLLISCFLLNWDKKVRKVVLVASTWNLPFIKAFALIHVIVTTSYSGKIRSASLKETFALRRFSNFIASCHACPTQQHLIPAAKGATNAMRLRRLSDNKSQQEFQWDLWTATKLAV